MLEKAFCSSFEEGRPRRSNNATLPQKIGAAGEVRRSPVPYRLPDRFKNRLDVLNERLDSGIEYFLFPVRAKTRYVRPRTLLGARGNAAHRPVRRQCRTRRRKSRQYSDLCCIACGTSFRAFAVVEGASIKWLLQVWDCFSVLYDGLSAVGYLSN